jgi:hypothetical protein
LIFLLSPYLFAAAYSATSPAMATSSPALLNVVGRRSKPLLGERRVKKRSRPTARRRDWDSRRVGEVWMEEAPEMERV